MARHRLGKAAAVYLQDNVLSPTREYSRVQGERHRLAVSQGVERSEETFRRATWRSQVGRLVLPRLKHKPNLYRRDDMESSPTGWLSSLDGTTTRGRSTFACAKCDGASPPLQVVFLLLSRMEDERNLYKRAHTQVTPLQGCECYHFDGRAVTTQLATHFA